MASQGGEDQMETASKYRTWTLAVVSLATAMLMLDIAVVNTAITDMGRDLHTGLDGLKWVVDAYTLALAAVVLTTGSLADRLGRKRVFAAGMIVFTLASAAAAAATDITMLNIIRAVQGLGAAAMFATSMALLAHEFPGAKERAKALGVYGATIGGSFAFGPLVGGGLTSAFGWRSIFVINIPIGIYALAITRKYVRESKDPNARRIDWAGQTVLTAGLFLLTLGLLRGNDVGWGSAEIVSELSAAVVLIGLFVLIERRVKDPMLPLGLFRIPSFTGAQISAFAISGSLFAVYIYATIYMQQVLGLSAIEAGLAYIPGTILNAATSGVTAGLAEKGKLSSRTMVSLGLAMVSVGLVLMTTAGAGSSWLAIQPGLLIAMIGTGMFNPAVIAVALGSVSEDQSGLAAGVNDTFRQAGIAVGVAALGAMIPTTALAKGDVTSYVDGLHNALVVGGALAAVGAIAAAYLIRPALQARRESAPAVPAVVVSEVALEPCA
jgi:EmrB/QacA subfamily drug resistance transporter